MHTPMMLLTTRIGLLVFVTKDPMIYLYEQPENIDRTVEDTVPLKRSLAVKFQVLKICFMDMQEIHKRANSRAGSSWAKGDIPVRPE